MEPTDRVPELRPEIVFLFDLVRQLVDGTIRIPRFQRPFVWRREQMTDLLDSINRQYPIGSLLAWETDSDIASLSSIGPVRLTQAREGSTAFLLDGHQRLSTIAGALIGAEGGSLSEDEDPSRWNIYYNALDSGFEHLEIGEDVQPYHFPMAKILDTLQFLLECKRILDLSPDKGQLYVERIQQVARAFQNYKIPIIRIRQTGLTEAVEIFARLNSKGQDMTADQIVSALLYREGEHDSFDLAEAITESMNILSVRGFGGIDRTVVLRTLLAAAGEDIYRTDWTRIASSRRDELLGRIKAVIPSVNRSLAAAADFLKAELGVSTDRLLPYAMQMTVLASFFWAAPDPSISQIELVKKWFWVSSFSGWFGGANPSRVNALVRDVIDNVAAEKDTPNFATVSLTSQALPVPRSFDMRSARTRVLLLVLLSLGPRGIDGSLIADPDTMLQLYGPEAVGYVAATVHDREIARSPANRIFKYEAKETGQARTWLLACSPEARESIWKSHAIPLEAVDALSQNDGGEFLRARLKLLTQTERSFMEERGVLPPDDSADTAPTSR